MSTLVQIIINTVITGGGYVLLSLGFNLLFKVVKFVDISYGAILVIGMYAMLFFYHILGLNIFLAVFLSLAVTILAELLFNKIFYKPLRKKGTNTLIPLVVSLGVYSSVVAIISLLFSSQYKTLIVGDSIVFSIYGGSFTLVNLVIVVSAIVFCITIIFILYHTRYGQALRAIDDDTTIAEISGIDVERIITKTIIIATLIITLTGIIFGFDTGVLPTVGLIFLLKGIISAIVGGIGSVEGGIFGALILAVVENLTIFFVAAQWRDPVAFLVFILILIFRPQGLFKRP
jgi:branched-subunit amino acid ABC-type transport system permease component